MTATSVILALQWFFLSYFIALSVAYLMLNAASFAAISRYMQWRRVEVFPEVYSGLEPPITILVPAYNEAATIVASVYSLLQLNYPEFEVLVINDGSRDDMLAVLIDEFELKPYPPAYWARLSCQPVRGAYHSDRYPNLRVLDKENGGKADSLNAGINEARHGLFCCIDADSILQRDSLQRIVAPFLTDARTVASGGTVRVANGCDVQDGFLVTTGLPRNPLALIQIVEYLRAFLFGRVGWSPINALLIISGAFGVFDREKVVAVGGYGKNTVGEDMELVVRLHRHMRRQRIPYRIAFVPDPICWTEAPESLRVLARQRIRWQRGLAESLWRNRGLLCHPRGGMVGWLAFPFFLVFEWFGPVIEVTGYVFVIVGFALGLISLPAFVAFLVVAIGCALILSLTALLLEELSFHTYRRRRDPFILFVAVFLENFGYRQINAVWRLVGLWRALRGSKHQWGEMTRSGTWQRSGRKKNGQSETK